MPTGMGKQKQPANGPSFVPRRRRGTPPLPRALANGHAVRQAGPDPPEARDLDHPTSHRHLAPRLRRDPQDHLLHVRLPLRHRRAPDPRPRQLHRGQPRPSGQSRRALRQGQRRHHAARLARPPARASSPHRAARIGRVRGDHLGRGARPRRLVAPSHPRDRARETRLLHRPRPVAELHRLVGAAIRHAELRRAWRLLLGQHGGGRHLHDGRRVLGIRLARLGAHQALHDLRRGRGPRQQPDQDGSRPAQGARGQDHRRQPGPHRLQRHRG